MMKHVRSIYVVALLFALPGLAQIPNGGFENWTTIGSYQDPNGWITLNAVTSNFGMTSCERGTPGAVGAAFAKVNTVNLTGIGIVPGTIISGDVASGVDGFPYTSRPGAMNGQYKYEMISGDVGIIAVSLYRWDPGTMSREGIGFGSITITGSQSNWSSFSIPFTYVSAMDPDTASITILSSSEIPVAGSYIGVDDLAFGPPVGIEELAGGTQLFVHPSPARTQLFLQCDERMSDVTILDMKGGVVRTERPTANRATLEIADLTSGLYSVRVRLDDGRLMRRTFMKE